MATSRFTRICRKCGYGFTTYSYGHIEDPIGIPFIKCSRCEHISLNKAHKEWVQMTPFEKYFAIAPRGNLLALLLAFIPPIILIKFSPLFENCSNGIAFTLSFLGVASLFWLIFDYIFVCIRANSWKFYDRITPSIARCRKKEYVDRLKKCGEIYSEDIPAFVIFTPASRATVEHYVEKIVAEEVPFEIPNFENSIRNY